MLQLDWATLAFQTINFLVLLWLLNRFLFKPLRRKLDERGRTIAEDLQSARSQEAKAAQLRTEWEERRRTVEEEAEETLLASRREASEMSADLFEEARTRLDRLTEEMRLDLARQRNEIIVQQYDEILDTIITLSGNVVQSVTTRRTHDDLVTNFCASIYQMSQTDIDEYRRLLAGRIPTAFVSSSTVAWSSRYP